MNFWQIFLTEKAPCLLNDWSNNRLICFTFTRRIPLDWKGIVLTRVQQALYLLFCLFCRFIATFLRRLSIGKRLFSAIRLFLTVTVTITCSYFPIYIFQMTKSTSTSPGKIISFESHYAETWREDLGAVLVIVNKNLYDVTETFQLALFSQRDCSLLVIRPCNYPTFLMYTEARLRMSHTAKITPHILNRRKGNIIFSSGPVGRLRLNRCRCSGRWNELCLHETINWNVSFWGTAINSVACRDVLRGVADKVGNK